MSGKGFKIGHESSPSQINNGKGTDWTTLSAELLMMIFNELSMENSLNDINSILRARQVHPHWKLVTDELLEKWCLEYWTKWNADERLDVEHHYDFPRVTFIDDFENIDDDSDEVYENLDGFGVEDILCPDYLLGNPPSTKHVGIGDRVGEELLVKNDFSKYGHHLTSLTFTFISASNPLSLATLARVLHLTPNLKAVSIEDVDIKREDKASAEQIILPSLFQIEHVKLRRATDDSQRAEVDGFYQFSNIEWFLKPYKTQLVSLQTDNCFEWDPNVDGLLAYPNLKWFKAWPPSPELLKAEVMFPSLQSLSLGYLMLEETTLQLIQKFISRFSTTLIELHLCIRQSLQGYKAPRPRTYSKWRDGDEAFGPPITNLTFPLLKAFGIFYPKNEEEERVAMDFLKMFPALETLKLLLSFEFEIPVVIIRSYLRKQKYWNVCPMLKKIRVQVEGYPEGHIFTMIPPFS